MKSMKVLGGALSIGATASLAPGSPCSDTCWDGLDALALVCNSAWGAQNSLCVNEANSGYLACGDEHDLCIIAALVYENDCRDDCNGDDSCKAACTAEAAGIVLVCNALFDWCNDGVDDAWDECVAQANDDRNACSDDATAWWDDCMTSCGC